MSFLLHPEADAEFADAVRYYAEVSPELGVRFYREMERLFTEICANPRALPQIRPSCTQTY